MTPNDKYVYGGWSHQPDDVFPDFVTDQTDQVRVAGMNLAWTYWKPHMLLGTGVEDLGRNRMMVWKRSKQYLPVTCNEVS